MKNKINKLVNYIICLRGDWISAIAYSLALCNSDIFQITKNEEYIFHQPTLNRKGFSFQRRKNNNPRF